MDELIAEQYVPGQYTGSQTETSAYVTAEDEETAKKIFSTAKERLLNIHQWHELCGFLSPAFQLTNSLAQPVKRLPEIGDYIRINIPGPGTTAGRGYDWVLIERLTHIHIDAQQELFFMQVRPASYPRSGDHAAAHFFRSTATGSFILVRELMQVTAAVYGRNEVPNTGTENSLDNIRNQVVGSSGAFGLSEMQWKSLVSAVLKNN